MDGLLVVIALAGIMFAVGSFISARNARRFAQAQKAELSTLRAAVENAEKVAAESRKEAKERREEATSLREQVRDIKRRSFEQKESSRKTNAIDTHREEMERLSAKLAAARDEAAHGADQMKSLQRDLEKVTSELERAREAARNKIESAPVAPAPAPVTRPAPSDDSGKLSAETVRADRAEAKLTETRKRLFDVEKDLKGARGRLETEKRLYTVQKGEIELAQDRYAELRRRHEKLRKDHDELIAAVRQAAREDRKLAEEEGVPTASTETPAADEPAPETAP